jgi:ribosomal protein S18 acetylase RimI-like enzyme
MDYTVTEALDQGYIVRALHEADLDALWILDNAAFTSPWAKSQLQEELGNPQALVLGIFLGETLIAALLLRQQADEAWVFRVMVHPLHRKKGLGKQLMKIGLKALSTLGFTGKMLRLEVAENNVAAIELYKILGFALTRRREAYYPQQDPMLPALAAIEMARLIP